MGQTNTKSNQIAASVADCQNSNIKQQKPQESIPELRMKCESWTRESHGLYDFEGTEILQKNLMLKGDYRITRVESQVEVKPIKLENSPNNQESGCPTNLESYEIKIPQAERDRIIARILFREGSYWIFHKSLIDDKQQTVLDTKPEEKIWRIVKRNFQAQNPDQPCILLKRHDLIKVGRVRFKIREIMSPAYLTIQEQNEYYIKKFNMLYPSFDNSSFLNSNGESDQSSMANSQAVISEQLEQIPQRHPIQQDEYEATDSDQDELNQVIRPGRQINFNQVAPGSNDDNLPGINDDNEDDLDDLGFDPNGTATQLMGQTQRFGAGGNNDIARRVTMFNPKPKKVNKKAPKDNGEEFQKEVLKKISEKKSENSLHGEKPACRICLCEDDEDTNPLIKPCKCAGSMAYIHHECLKTWFHGKRVVKNSSIVTTYFWKNLECELCKTPYPYETRSIDGKQWLNIIEYDKPALRPDGESYFMVLESISSNTSKVIHVINMERQNKIFIGRGHDAHIRVTDISVSRLHAALIKSPHGYYFLQDNHSKFGTLSLVKTPLQLKPQTCTTLQIGRTVLQLEVRHSFSQRVKECCGCAQSKSKKNKKNRGANSTQLMSLNGLDYFPMEFSTSEYTNFLQKKKKHQLKKIQQFQKQKGSPVMMDTRQDQSDIANVDFCIDSANNMNLPDPQFNNRHRRQSSGQMHSDRQFDSSRPLNPAGVNNQQEIFNFEATGAQRSQNWSNELRPRLEISDLNSRRDDDEDDEESESEEGEEGDFVRSNNNSSINNNLNNNNINQRRTPISNGEQDHHNNNMDEDDERNQSVNNQSDLEEQERRALEQAIQDSLAQSQREQQLRALTEEVKSNDVNANAHSKPQSQRRDVIEEAKECGVESDLGDDDDNNAQFARQNNNNQNQVLSQADVTDMDMADLGIASGRHSNRPDEVSIMTTARGNTNINPTHLPQPNNFRSGNLLRQIASQEETKNQYASPTQNNNDRDQINTNVHVTQKLSLIEAQEGSGQKSHIKTPGSVKISSTKPEDLQNQMHFNQDQLLQTQHRTPTISVPKKSTSPGLHESSLKAAGAASIGVNKLANARGSLLSQQGPIPEHQDEYNHNQLFEDEAQFLQNNNERLFVNRQQQNSVLSQNSQNIQVRPADTIQTIDQQLPGQPTEIDTHNQLQSLVNEANNLDEV